MNKLFDTSRNRLLRALVQIQRDKAATRRGDDPREKHGRGWTHQQQEHAEGQGNGMQEKHEHEHEQESRWREKKGKEIGFREELGREDGSPRQHPDHYEQAVQREYGSVKSSNIAWQWS